jgi:type II secretory ATPase GspE/PulE/Tfp pilus assembly ATPase PilB-like protein
MRRAVFIAVLAGLAAMLAIPAIECLAQGAAGAGWAELQPDKWNDRHSIARYSGPAVSWLKLLPIFLIYLVWVKSGDWVNRDTQIFGLSYGTWNSLLYFPFVLALLFIAFPFTRLGVPNYIVAAIMLPLCYLATFVPYVLAHNRSVQLHQKVFTPDWFRFEISRLGSKVGLKIHAERLAEYEKGAKVDLMAAGAADDRENQANLITARQSPGYLLVKELIADMVARRSDRLILDYTQEAVATRYHIDGVWHNGEPREREASDVMLAVMKTLANLNANERRKKQEGKFAAKYEEHSYMCPIVSQGVQTGERVLLHLLGGYQRNFKKYEDLGMRPKLAEQWAALMGRDQGLIVISALPEGGLTTLTDVSLMETDRLMRDFVSIESLQKRDRDIENIEVTTYNAAAGETAVTVLPSLIRKYPNVYVMRDFSDPEAARLLLNEIKDDRLVVTTVHAKDAVEALVRLLQMNVPQREFAESITAVLCTRLVRKLCDACKVAYPPAPELLKKLGIPAGKVEALYRVPKPEEVDKPCKQCGGIGFMGRIALFELLVADDRIRGILARDADAETLRKAARIAGMRTFQEEGLLLVAKGVTSIPELQRILKL